MKTMRGSVRSYVAQQGSHARPMTTRAHHPGLRRLLKVFIFGGHARQLAKPGALSSISLLLVVAATISSCGSDNPSRNPEEQTQTGEEPGPTEQPPARANPLRVVDNDGVVRAISINRDGSRAVSGGLNGIVRLWNVETGEEVLFDSTPSHDGRSLGYHDGAVYAVAISADGNRAITGGVDGMIRLWDTTTGEEIRYPAVDNPSETRSLGSKGSWIYAVAMNQDGSRAVSGGFDGTVRFWNTELTGDGVGTEIRYPDGGDGMRSLSDGYEYLSVYAVALSDDGSRAMSGGANGVLHIWNTRTGAIEGDLFGTGSMGPVYGVALSGDGVVAIAGSADNKVHVWNAFTGKTHTLLGHAADVSSVALNTDKTRVVSASGDGTVRFWNVDTGSENNGGIIRTLRRHTDYVWSVGLSGDGTIALSGGADGTINFWDTSTSHEATPEPFATSEPDTDPEHRSDMHSQQLSDHTFGVSDVSLSANGRFALSGSSDTAAHLWDATTGEHLRTISDHENEFFEVCLSADGHLALALDDDNVLSLWNTTTGELLRTMNGRLGEITSATLSADGRLAMSGNSNGTLRLWDTATGDRLRVMRGHTDGVLDVSLSMDGRLALSGGRDNTVRLWDTTTGKLMYTMNGHQDLIDSVVLSMDGRLALSGSLDDTLRLWDATTGKLLHTMHAHHGSSGSIALSADGRLALSGSGRTMHLWNTTTGELLRTVRGPPVVASRVALSADGRFILSGGNDAQLWRIGRSHAANPSPTIDAEAGTNQTVTIGTVVTLDGSASNKPGNDAPVAYSWRQTAGPNMALSATSSTATATFSVPKVPADATLTFELAVMNTRGFIVTDEVSIMVNTPPRADAGDDQTLVAGADVTLTASGSSDPGGTDITYSWVQTGGTPTMALSDASVEQPTFATPNVITDTILTFMLTVTDADGLTDTDEVSIDIRSSLTALVGDDRVVGSRAVVTLDGSSSGAPGGAPIGYAWVQTSGPTVMLSAADTAMPTFTAPAVDPWITTATMRLEFQLTITDEDGLAHADSVSVSVGKVDLLSMDDHDGAVRAVSISRDGSLAVSGGMDGTVRLWDTNTGEEILFDATANDGGRSLGRHDDAVYAVAISADGNRAISGDIDGILRLWDTATGTEIRYAVAGGTRMRGLGYGGIWVYAVALNVDGSRALSGGFDGAVRFWNTETTGTDAGTEIRYIGMVGSEMASLGSHAITDDGGTIETDDDLMTRVSVYSVSLSDDGSRALSGGADGAVRLWNTITGTEMRGLMDDDAMGPVYGVFLSGNGKVAVSGGADNNVHVWDVDTRAEAHELTGHAADVSSVALSVDQSRVLSAGGDGTVRLWNVDPDSADEGTQIRVLRRHTDYVWSTGLGGITNIALSGGADGSLNLWDTATSPADTQETFATREPDTPTDVDNRAGDVDWRELSGHEDSVLAVALSADGHRALSGGYDGNVRFWDAVTGELLQTMGNQRDQINDVALSADGRLALSARDNNTVRVWNTTTGELLHTMSDVYRASLSADGQLALSAGTDRTVRLWNPNTGEHLRTMATNGFRERIGSVSLSRNGRVALSGEYGGALRLWDTATGDLLRTVHGSSGLSDTSLSADGRLGLSVSTISGSVAIFRNMVTGEPLHTINYHTSAVRTVALSADGRLALLGNVDNAIQLRDATTGELLRTMRNPRNESFVYDVSMSADGRFGLSGSDDGALYLWRIGRSQAIEY